jgi:hypothetical protein
VDLGRLIDLGHPARRVTQELTESGSSTLSTDVLAPFRDSVSSRMRDAGVPS